MFGGIYSRRAVYLRWMGALEGWMDALEDRPLQGIRRHVVAY